MKSAAHQYEDKLLEFAYGELPPHEASAVDAHVQGCTRCAELLSEIRGVRATMAQLPMEQAPDAGLDSLLAYAEQAARRNTAVAAPPSLWKRLLMPLASVAALATVGVVSYRANQQLDLSPAAAVADQKVAQVRDQQAAELGAKKLDRYDSVEEAPAPVAAAEPAKAQPEGGEQYAQAELEPDRREWGGKRGRAEEPPASKPSPKPQSLSKRAKQKAADPSDLLQDYSNAGGGGLAQGAKGDAAPPPPPAQQAPMDKGGTFGLGSGSGLLGGVGTGRGSAAPAEEKSKDAPARAAKEEAAPSAPKVTTAAPAPSTPMPSAAPPPPSKKSSYGLRPLSGSSANSSLSADDESVALERVDNMGLDRDAKFAERQRAETRTSSLEGARAASRAGDRATEIRLAAEVLSSGAVGSERVEALKRLCDAWEALGQPERADPFCDQLLSEFPTSTAARAVEERRGRMQRVSPAKTTSDAPMPSAQ